MPVADPSQLDLRPYQHGDEARIIDLFEQSFGSAIAPEFWRWRYLDHPAGGPLIELAWDGDRLAAHYAVSHAPLTIDGEPTAASLSMTTMTHPDYRGMGLFPSLAERLYARLGEMGHALVHGFPNVMSHSTFAKSLGWQDVRPLPMLAVAPSKARGCSLEPKVRRVDVIDDAFADLLGALPVRTGIRRSRDAELMRWRIDANPQHSYERWLLMEGGEAAAYAIAKAFGDGALDLVEIDGEPAAVAALIGHVVADAAGRQISAVSTWCSLGDPMHASFERKGFTMAAPVTYHGGRAFREGDDLFDPRRWSVSMLDSDLF